MKYHIKETRCGGSLADRREFSTLFEALEAATIKVLRLKELGGEAQVQIGSSAPGENRVTKLITINVH